MKTTVLKVMGGIVVLALLWTGYSYFGVYHMPLPWKVTNPHDPQFNEEAFRFEDYYGRDGSERLRESMRVMFPIGTPKAKVDRILYENQPKYTEATKWGAVMKKDERPRKPDELNVYRYSYRPYPNPLNIFLVIVFYDAHDRVKEIDEIRKGPLYNTNFFGEN